MGFIATPGAAPFQYDVFIENWEMPQTFPLINRSGPSGRPKWRLGDMQGSLKFYGKVQNGYYPWPMLPKFATGTLRIVEQSVPNAGFTANTDTNYVEMQGRISAMEFSRNNKTQNEWDYEGTFTADGAATISWSGTQYTITAATTNYAQTDVGSSWTYDPNFLQAKATTRVDVEGISDNDSSNVAAMVTYIASISVPPEPNLKVITSTFIRTDSTGGHFSIGWGLNDTDDFVTNPPTSSYRASQRPYTDSTAVVVNSGTTSVAQQANVLWDTFQTVPYALGVRVRPLTDTKRLATYDFINPGVYYKGTGKAAPQQVPYMVQSGNIYVYLSSNLTYGTGRRIVQASYTDYVSAGRELLEYTIVRHVTDTAVPRQYPNTINSQTLPYYMTTNNASFQGNSVGTTIYTGVSFTIRAGLSAAAPIVVGYSFKHDSEGIVLGVNQINFNQPTIINSTISATGWVLGAALGAPFSSLFFPSQMSFDAFANYPP